MNWTRMDASAAHPIPPMLLPLSSAHDIAADTRSDGEPPAAPGLYLAQLLGILRRRCRLILTVAACGTLLAAAVSLLIAPKYTAIAQILVEPAPAASGTPPSVAADETTIDTQVKMLTSHDHLQRVVDSLLADPQFIASMGLSGRTVLNPAAKPDEPAKMTQNSSIVSELNRRLHIWFRVLHKDRHGIPFDLDDLQHDLRVNQEDRSRVITVRFTSASPEGAAIVANRIVQSYLDDRSERQQDYASSELTRIREQSVKAKSEMARKSAAVQQAMQERSRAAQTRQSDEAHKADARLRDLEREAAASALLYSDLQRQEKEALGRPDHMESDVRILSLATPPNRPSSHNPLLFILPAFVLFLIGGSFIAVIAEQCDHRLRSERDIGDALGIPCAGLVPHLPRMRGMRPHQYMLTAPFSIYTETIRSVVGALWLTTPHRTPVTVLVSSSIPGEGKTTAAVSIAVCAAMLGRRVLLIDLDFKRPSIARELGSKAGHGLFDILLHNRAPAEVITHIPDLGIDHLPMSACPVDILPLLSGNRMPQLLRELSENYDSVIIDGPPLLGITESRFLASMVDKVLFVVKWGSTRREIAQNAMSLLRGSDAVMARNAGTPTVLLTQVNLKEHAGYRYGDVSEALVKYENYYTRPV